MPVTILRQQTEEKQVIIPKSRGVEERDHARYPLPPNTPVALLRSVCDELRQCGHDVSYHLEREKLVSWDLTHKHNQRSYGWDDEWRPDPKAPVVLHFVSGGCDIVVRCGDRRIRLEPHMLRAGRDMLRLCIAGRP